MYKKFLVVASKQDTAGINIINQLYQFKDEPLYKSLDKFFDIYIIEESVLYEGNLNLRKIEEYDFIIFASKHLSEKNEKSLTVHAPGILENGREKLCPTSALFIKFLFNKLNENAQTHGLSRLYHVSLEATHHGPLINKPCLFIEIGSTELEWKDKRAGFVIAKTISEVIQNFIPNKYHEIAIGIGGPHYCPSFKKIQLNSNVAVSHIIPKYILEINEKMIMEAWNKTNEDPDFALLDWKGFASKEQKNKVIEILEKNHLPWKKVSEIKR